MTHGVDAAMKEVQTPDLAAIRDSVAVQTDGEQLRDRDHPMLRSSQFGQRRVGCAEFVGTIAMNFVHPVNRVAGAVGDGAMVVRYVLDG